MEAALGQFVTVSAMFAVYAAAVVIHVRVRHQRRASLDRQAYRVVFPQGLTHEAVLQFVLNLGGLPRGLLAHSGIILQEWGDNTGIHHRIIVPAYKADLVDQLRTAIRGVRLEPDNEAAPFDGLTVAAEAGLTDHYAPLNVTDPAKIAASILTTFCSLGKGEVLVKQLIIKPTDAKLPKSNRTSIQLPRGGGWLGITTGIFNAVNSAAVAAGTGRYEERLARAQQKVQGPMFSAALTIGAKAGGPGRATQLINRVFDALNAAHGSNAKFVPAGFASAKKSIERIQKGIAPLYGWHCTFNARELTGIWATPINSPSIPGLRLGGARQVPPSPDIPTKGRVLANSNFPGLEDRPIAVSRVEAMRHTHVIGKTGVGKSVLLVNLAVQDMLSGAGITVIDPNGDLVTDLLERIPPGREDDVIVFDPTDKERTIGLNLLARDENPSRQTDDVVGMFRRFSKDSWGPRLERTLRAAVRTLVMVPDRSMTLVEVGELLLNDQFRDQVLERTYLFDDLRSFWVEFNAMKPAERRQVLDPVINKLQALTFRDEIRHIIAQSEPLLNMDQVLNQGKILLVRLPKGPVGEDTAAVTGSLVLMSQWQAAQRRIQIPEDRRRPHYVIVDEFQNFTAMPTRFEIVLAEARKYKYGLTLAHQSFSQFGPGDAEIAHAVQGNALTKVMFQMSAKDAGIMANEFKQHLKPEDLTGQATREVTLSVSTDSAIKPGPCTGRTTDKAPVTSDPVAIKEASDAKYTMPRRFVEMSISKRREAYLKRPPIGRRPVADA